MVIAMACIWRLGNACARRMGTSAGESDMKLPVAAIATLLLAGCGSRSADQQTAKRAGDSFASLLEGIDAKRAVLIA